MKSRHNWQPLKSRTRWRNLDVCTICFRHRWLVQFKNSSGKLRASFLYSNADHYDPWSSAQFDCKRALPTKGSAR